MEKTTRGSFPELEAGKGPDRAREEKDEAGREEEEAEGERGAAGGESLSAEPGEARTRGRPPESQ